MPPTNLNLAAALELADAGISIFPVHVSWNEKKLKKKPAVRWRTKATTARLQIESWWRAIPDAVPGIELGRAGLVVVDLDCHEGKPNGLKTFEELLGTRNLPVTPTTRTGQNGRHIFFRQPSKPFRCGPLPPGIEVRGAGRLVVAPGATYDRFAWRPVGGTPPLAEAFKNNLIPELPEELCELLFAAGRRGSLEQPNPAASGIGPATQKKWPLQVAGTERCWLPKDLYLKLCRLMPVGGKVLPRHHKWARSILSELIEKWEGRNDALNEAAFDFRRVIDGGFITRVAAESLLFDAATLNGYIAKDGFVEAWRTIRSGLGAALINPAT